MDAQIVGSILFLVLSFIAFLACIPPLKQSIKEGFKPGIWISIVSMIIMLILIYKFIRIII
jgi:hypothetical protein